MESRQSRIDAAREALKSVESRIGAPRESIDTPELPLAPMLSALLPRGLRRGQVISVQGSTSLMLALAAQASHEGSWVAMVGMPHVGLLAASMRGIELSRLAFIPRPGIQAGATIGACIEGMDVVMVGQGLALSDADRRRLASRARERGSVIVSEGAWELANVALTVERSRWKGPGSGEGRLREREITVAVQGRSMGPVSRVLLVLDADANALSPRPGRVGQAEASIPSTGAA